MKGLIAALILLIIIGLLLGLRAEDFVGDDPEEPASEQYIPEATEVPNSSTENGNTDTEAGDPLPVEIEDITNGEDNGEPTEDDIPVENEEDDRDRVDTPPASKKVEGIPALW